MNSEKPWGAARVSEIIRSPYLVNQQKWRQYGERGKTEERRKMGPSSRLNAHKLTKKTLDNEKIRYTMLNIRYFLQIRPFPSNKRTHFFCFHGLTGFVQNGHANV